MNNFCDLFSYKSSYQETITRDRRFTNCTFLIDFYDYKKGEYVEVIDVDYNNYDLYIYKDYDSGDFKIYEPKWYPQNFNLFDRSKN